MGGFLVLITPILAQMAHYPADDDGYGSGVVRTTYAQAESRPFMDLGMPIGGFVLLVLLMLLVALPIWMALRQSARKRDLEHAERMKALELGRPMPGKVPWWSPARVALAIGAGVPISVFGVVWLAALTTDTDGSFAWPVAGTVSLAAVICGTILALNLPQSNQDAPTTTSKPAFDPDAHGIVGHQG